MAQGHGPVARKDEVGGEELESACVLPNFTEAHSRVPRETATRS